MKINKPNTISRMYYSSIELKLMDKELTPTIPTLMFYMVNDPTNTFYRRIHNNTLNKIEWHYQTLENLNWYPVNETLSNVLENYLKTEMK